MKLLFCNDHLGVGGVERVMVTLANACAARGDAVSCMLMLQQPRVMQPHLRPEIQVESLGLKGFKRPFQVLGAAQQLLQHFRRHTYDAVVVAKPYNVPIVTLAHRFSGTGARLIAAVHEDAGALLAECSGVRRLLLWLCYRYVYPAAGHLVAVSDASAASAAAVMRVDVARITVIANPVITPQLAVQMREAPAHVWLQHKTRPVFISVGRLSAEKNIALMLSAFAQVCSIMPCYLLVLGDGPLRAVLEMQAQALGISDHVAFTGIVANPYASMAQADALVLSSHHEALPSVIIEALACGTAVIATHCSPTIATMLGQGKLGTIVPAGDIEALAAAMLQQLRRPHLVDRQALKQALAGYTDDVALQHYDRLWRAA